MRVVIADDHPHFRFAVRALLESEGFEVVAEAEDGDSAVAAVEAARPDVVLLDLRMPGLAAAEALAALRERSPGTRVIVLTGSQREEDVAAARAAGVAGYVVKGDDQPGLIAAMRAAMEG